MVHLNKLFLLLADFRAHTQVTIFISKFSRQPILPTDVQKIRDNDWERFLCSLNRNFKNFNYTGVQIIKSFSLVFLSLKTCVLYYFFLI